MQRKSASQVVVQLLSHVSLWLHGLQHARLLCPPLSPRVCSNSCPLNQWCYVTISFSATPWSFCFQSFPASGSFPLSQLFTSGGQSIGASATVLPVNIQGWFPLGLIGLISMQSKGFSRVFSSPTIWKHQFVDSAFFMVQLSHLYMTGQTIALTRWTFVSKVMSLLFNMLSKFIIARFHMFKGLFFPSVFPHAFYWGLLFYFHIQTHFNSLDHYTKVLL